MRPTYPNRGESCNLASIDVMDLTHRVADIYLGGQFAASLTHDDGAANPLQLDSTQQTARAGIYVDPDGDLILRIREQKGGLWADSLFDGSTELKALGDSRFRHPALGEIHFGSARLPGTLTVNGPGNKPSRYIRVPDYTPSGIQLREFIGTYHSSELSIPYYITIDGGHLRLNALKLENVVPASTGAALLGAPVVLEPVTTDLFACKGWRVRFIRDARHHVSGFLINTTYVTRNLRFVRSSS